MWPSSEKFCGSGTVAFASRYHAETLLPLPLIVERPQVDQIFGTLAEVLKSL